MSRGNDRRNENSKNSGRRGSRERWVQRSSRASMRMPPDLISAIRSGLHETDDDYEEYDSPASLATEDAEDIKPRKRKDESIS